MMCSVWVAGGFTFHHDLFHKHTTELIVMNINYCTVRRTTQFELVVPCHTTAVTTVLNFRIFIFRFLLIASSTTRRRHDFDRHDTPYIYNSSWFIRHNPIQRDWNGLWQIWLWNTLIIIILLVLWQSTQFCHFSTHGFIVSVGHWQCIMRQFKCYMPPQRLISEAKADHPFFTLIHELTS